MLTFTNLGKYVYSKKCLKQRRQPPNLSLQKVEGIFAPKKTPGYGCYLYAIEFAYPADRVTKRSVYRSPLKVISYSPGLGVSEQLSQITGYVQLNKTAYTDLKSLSMSSTQVVALVLPTSTSASVTLISAVYVVLIEFMKKRNRKFVLSRILF